MIKKTFFICLFSTALGSTLLFSDVAAAISPCNLSSLKGAYRISFQGALAKGASPPAITAINGLSVYDGQGHFSSKATVNNNGEVNAVNVNGTYTINADCTSTSNMTVAGLPPLTFWARAEKIGGEKFVGITGFQMVSNTPGMVGTGMGRME